MIRSLACAAIALVPVVTPLSATADGCRMQTSGSRCVLVPESQKAPEAVSIGQVLDRGNYSILMNTAYYGLPPARDGWVYMRIDGGLYRVDWSSHEVLENVSTMAGRNF